MTTIINSSLFYSSIPSEVKIQIFQFLDIASIAAVARTCQEFNILANSSDLWKSKCELSFGNIQSKTLHESHKSWKFTYKNLHKIKKNEESDNFMPRRTTSISYGFFGFALMAQNFAPNIYCKPLNSRKISTYKDD